jgi:mycothiol system anti-sigma-R factor
MGCDCGKCEEMMQPYLDRVLDDSERVEAELHLAECEWCACRYRFEERLRVFVRTACSEPMPPSLKARLVALRVSGRLDL